MLVEILAKVNGLRRTETSHILLYHATFSKIPAALSEEVHNVSPQVLYKQLKWIIKYFDVINIDDYFQISDRRGKAAITFDDGYKSFFSEGFPVLKTLKIPCTVFICGCTMKKKAFWRDKIRFLINNNLVSEFLKFNSKSPTFDKLLNETNFYRRTKSPLINSFELDKMLDAFIEEKQISLEKLRYCAEQENELIDDSLVNYGNHTYDHYVLSSLSDEEQEYQIHKNLLLLQSTKRRISKVFSIPFGGEDDFNQTTCILLQKYGYIGFLYSRGHLNMLSKRGKEANIPLPSFDRYMPTEGFASFQKQLLRMTLKGFKLRRK
jgi:peptidoglycan/xylan/chitin deacetylase (PgdA/CDA1 family)